MRALPFDKIDRAFDRHERIAYQFSGGKDSLALLYMMRAYWERMTVYHLNTGDEHPELTKVIERTRGDVPITIVQSDVFSIKRDHGLPSDIVPWQCSFEAHSLNIGANLKLQQWPMCCYRTVMKPLHDRMKKDAVTLLVRGQKDQDVLKGPLNSGDFADGFEFLHPLAEFSDEDCFRFLAVNGIDLPLYYNLELPHSGDCMGCTAFTQETGRVKHLRAIYPERYEKFRYEMLEIFRAIYPIDRQINRAIDACTLNNA